MTHTETLAMDTSQKKELFDYYRKSLLRAGLQTTRDDSLVCPLCWAETSYNDLSFEHVVPASVGGSCKEALTCRRCNNQHGSALDAKLSHFQTVRDALQGHGTLNTTVNVNGKKMAADLKWGGQSTNFSVVARASNRRKFRQSRKISEWAKSQD